MVEEWVGSFSDGILLISPLDGSNSWPPGKRWERKRGSVLSISRLPNGYPKAPLLSQRPPPPWPLARHRLAEFPHVKSSELGVF